MGMVRLKVAVGGAAFVLAVLAFAALAGDVRGQQSLGGFRTELAQSSDKISSLESKLSSDKGQLNTVIRRLGEIKTAEAQIKQEQTALLNKERATRATVHDVRNKMLSIKYKIHNVKAVAFSDAMFGLSDKTSKKAKAHSNLARKAKAIEDEREADVADEEKPKAVAKKVAVEVSHLLHDTQEATGHAAVVPAKKSMPDTQRAAIIAEGLHKAQAQMEALRKQSKARAAAAVQKKALALEKERDASEREKRREIKAARKRAEKAAHKRAEEAAAVSAKREVSRMQAEVLRKRVTAMATVPVSPHVVGHPLEMRVAPTMRQAPQRAVAHKPLTLTQAAEAASHNAAKAQQMAFMRSPQFWASQHAIHTTKRYGMMPGLPLLAPLDSAAADP
jgi:hypothetical protein